MWNPSRSDWRLISENAVGTPDPTLWVPRATQCPSMGMYWATGELGASKSNPEDAGIEQGAFKLRGKAECKIEFYT